MTVHIAVKSYYSLLESALSIQDIVSCATHNHMKAIALCDHNVMYGTIAFYRACKKANIKPIIGLEADIKVEDEIIPFLLLAKDNMGYRVLLRLSTYLNTEADAVELLQLAKVSEHLVVIAYGEGGWLEGELIREDEKEAVRKLSMLRDLFPAFYLGISANDQSFWFNKNALWKNWGKQLNIPSVALPKVRYTQQTDEPVLKALAALRYKTTVKDEKLGSFANLHFLNSEEMLKQYDTNDILTTETIATLCNVNIDAEHAQLLRYPLEENISSAQYLKELCHVGLKKRFIGKEVPAEYHKRLTYELKVINDMKYDDYFLIVWDFIRFAKKADIYVGPGRGSSAGSIVAWTLGITHVDPIQYGLLFERFLNPERISMPDIDVDFPDDRRQEVIDYVAERYGKERVAHIIAFSTMQAKAALDASADALGVEKRKLEYAKKYLPKIQLSKNASVLKNTYNDSLRFRQLVEADEAVSRVFRLATRLEGMPRNITTHACGIVMSNKPLLEVIPLTKVDDTLLATQISAEYLEELGLLKMDFLGIRNLSIIDRVCSRITPKPDMLKLPLEDAETFEMIARGDTIGIFQLESDGMKNLIKRLKPRNLSELSDALALYRPGPMDNIAVYLANREHPEQIRYPHADLKPILRSTYGTMIYQEQILQITQVAAGFSLGKADILRRAVSKKKAGELKALEGDFLKGCAANGYPQETAQNLFTLIMKFAGYGFNRSHSIPYSLVAYQMCYLKVHYPLYFYTSLLNNVIGAETKTAEYLNECKRRNVKLLPISINHSKASYEIEGDAIRLPLRCVKKLGNSTVQEITDEIEARGPFQDYYDFVARINVRKVSKSVIESLIDAGALDEFAKNRAMLRVSLPEAFRYAELIKVDNPDQSYLDFNLVYKPVLTIATEDAYERLAREKEALGFYLSEHPITFLKKRENYTGKTITQLVPNEKTTLFVHLQRIRNHQAKTGGNMAFLTVDDESGSMDAVILPRNYEQYRDLLVTGSFLYLSGRIETGRNTELSMVIEKVSSGKTSENIHETITKIP